MSPDAGPADAASAGPADHAARAEVLHAVLQDRFWLPRQHLFAVAAGRRLGRFAQWHHWWQSQALSTLLDRFERTGHPASLRQAAGFTQAQAGAGLGYSRSAVARAEATGVCSRDFCLAAGRLFGAGEELALAHLLIRIPANPDYPSLNLAMAVQLLSYELFRAAGSPASSRPLSEPAVPLAPGAEMERFYAHLQQVMDEVDFKDRTTGGTHLMTRLRRLFQRCEMDQNEVNILRGILTSVQQKRRKAGE